MSDRSEKPKARKTLERLRLAESIERLGYEVLPCSFCAGKGLPCKMLEKSSRCAECARRGRACDAAGLATTLAQISAEFDRLEREEEAVEEQMSEVQAKLKDTINKLAKVRRQKKMLRTKGIEMVRRGVSTMDELEMEEQNEQQQQQQQQQQFFSPPQPGQIAEQQTQTLEQALTTDGFYMDWGLNMSQTTHPFPGPSSGEATRYLGVSSRYVPMEGINDLQQTAYI